MIWTVDNQQITGAVGVAIAALGTYDADDNYVPPALEAVQTWAVNEINRHAGDLRTQIGTDIPFQGDVYQLKQAEAIAFQTDDAPDATKYPVTYAEAAARGMQPADLAAEYLYNATAWPVLLANIEAMRMGAITAIQAAQTVAEIETVLSGL
jgi:hypothetical protein